MGSSLALGVKERNNMEYIEPKVRFVDKVKEFSRSSQTYHEGDVDLAKGTALVELTDTIRAIGHVLHDILAYMKKRDSTTIYVTEEELRRKDMRIGDIVVVEDGEKIIRVKLEER